MWSRNITRSCFSKYLILINGCSITIVFLWYMFKRSMRSFSFLWSSIHDSFLFNYKEIFFLKSNVLTTYKIEKTTCYSLVHSPLIHMTIPDATSLLQPQLDFFLSLQNKVFSSFMSTISSHIVFFSINSFYYRLKKKMKIVLKV